MYQVAVVVLNYNRSQDTINCLDSVLASDAPPAWIIVVDNASSDDSLHQLSLWAKSAEKYLMSEGASRLANKPFMAQYRVSAEPYPCPEEGSVVVVCNSVNKGYAAGNNVGIHLALGWGADAVWILNNDTIVDKSALGAMRDRLFCSERPGLCGSMVCYSDNRQIVQCMGGGMSQIWTGMSKLCGNMMSVEDAKKVSYDVVEAQINFIYGASVMASRKFITTVGLMDERFFLYCEEQDWACSAKGQFDLVYASSALVYHKEGATTGFSASKISLRSLYLLVRSRILLTAKHKPLALPIVLTAIFFVGVRLVWRRVRLGIYGKRFVRN